MPTAHTPPCVRSPNGGAVAPRREYLGPLERDLLRSLELIGKGDKGKKKSSFEIIHSAMNLLGKA